MLGMFIMFYMFLVKKLLDGILMVLMLFLGFGYLMVSVG